MITFITAIDDKYIKSLEIKKRYIDLIFNAFSRSIITLFLLRHVNLKQTY